MILNSLLFAVMLLLTSTTGLALEISSIAPHRATPDTVVAVSGGPFSSKTRVFIGEELTATARVLPGQLEFVVPAVPAGSYTLTVHDQGETAMAHFFFEVLPLPPAISALVPDNLDSCADTGARVVQVQGRNFQPDTMLLLDGKVIGSRTIDAGQLEFHLPELAAGVYGVEVRNNDGTASLPQSLWINSIPEISYIERGADQVNHYDMIIHGKNFFYNSIVVVREPENPALGSGYLQWTLAAGTGNADGRNNPSAAPGESLTYNNCTTLVYRRYPLNMQDKELLIQVINPDGKKTERYAVTMP